MGVGCGFVGVVAGNEEVEVVVVVQVGCRAVGGLGAAEDDAVQVGAVGVGGFGVRVGIEVCLSS